MLRRFIDWWRGPAPAPRSAQAPTRQAGAVPYRVTDKGVSVLLVTSRRTGRWVFPKGDSLTVGVIDSRGAGEATRAYLRDFIERLGLADREILHESGHLTRCRTPDSPRGAGRVRLVGDSAGLLEPWTREGISFATRSGALAGAAAAVGPDGALARYEEALDEDLIPEMAAGERCLRAFEARPAAFHRLIASTPLGWRQFVRLASGETTLARAWDRRAVRLGVGLLSRGSRTPPAP